MTRAIKDALRPTAYEIEREERRKKFEAAYFEKQKEETKMTKERFAKMTDEEKEAHRRKNRSYMKEYQKRKKAREEALAEEQALEDAIQAVAEIPLPEDNVITKELAEQYRKKWIDAPRYAVQTYEMPVENGDKSKETPAPDIETVKQVLDYVSIVDRYGRKMKLADICLRRSIITGEETVEVIITPN